MAKPSALTRDDPDDGVLAHLPPYDTEAEEAVIAACLLDSSAPARLLPMLSPDDFFREANGNVWRIIGALFAAKSNIDLITVTAALRANGLVTARGEESYQFYLSQILSDVPTVIGAEDYARIVADRAGKRRLISFAGTLAGEAFSSGKSFLTLVADAELRLRELVPASVTNGTTTLAEISPEEMDDMLAWAEDPHGSSRAIPTGLQTLDEKLTGGGLLPGKMYTVGASTGMGKSSILRWILKNQVQHGERVCLFSLEQDRKEVREEVVYGLAGIDPQEHEYYGTPLAPDESRVYHDAVQTIHGFDKFHINDRARLRPIDIRLILSQLKADHPDLSVIAIDYLHLMAPDHEVRGQNAEERLSTIVTEVRDLAKEFEVACLLASQLTKEVMDKRANPDLRPKLQHFRGSGVVTQVSYAVISLFSVDYAVLHNLLEADPNDLDRRADGSEVYRRHNTLEIGILKQQRGAHGTTIEVGFNPAKRQIYDLGEEMNT